MVIEMLSFRVDPSERARWLDVEEHAWSRFLERQDGFVRKEMWVADDDPGLVCAVIWWESMAQWKAISSEAVAEVDERMGPWLRPADMRAFHVVRDC